MKALQKGLLAAILSGVSCSAKVGEDPDWNYLDHGLDWTMGNCPDKVEGETVQSPLNVQSTTSIPWSSSDVAFFTAW